MNLIETNHQINITFFIYEYKFTIENKKKQKKSFTRNLNT